DARRRLRGMCSENLLEHPRSAQDRRGPVRIRRRQQHATLAEQAEARLIGELDAAKARAANVVDAVVQREALVEIRVVGRQEIEHVAIFAENAVDEAPSLFDEVRTDAAIHVAEDEWIRRQIVELRKPEPLVGKIRSERLRAG